MPPPPDIPPTPQAPVFMAIPPPSVVAMDAIASTKSNVVSQSKCKREQVAKKSMAIMERNFLQGSCGVFLNFPFYASGCVNTEWISI